jgi:predicted P-loop ATPase/GTPase
MVITLKRSQTNVSDMPRVVLKKERCIFTLILLVPLIIAVVSSDIVTVGAWVVAIFFVWLVPLRLDVSSSHHRSMVVLIENELKKSENPSNEFYTIFDRLVKKNELQKEEMLEILSYFSSREDDVGVAARRLRNGILS